MKLAVIVFEFGAAANIGGSGETFVRTFDLPPEIAEYIAKNRSQWSTVSLAIEDDKP